MLLCVVPRLGMAGLLGVVGVKYLVVTSTLEDLLLNAMALAFIMDVDELFFSAFAPHRVKSLVTGLRPLNLRPAHLRRMCSACGRAGGGSLYSLLKIVLVVGVLALLRHYLLIPFHGRLEQARDILCSGEKDFVYTLNPANGMVLATRSSTEDEWSSIECTVLLLAHPELRLEHGWELPEAARRACGNLDFERLKELKDESNAELRPAWAEGLDEEGAEYNSGEFDYVRRIAAGDVGQSVGALLCEDMVRAGRTDQRYLAALRDAVQDQSIYTCTELADRCWERSMGRLRSLCPVTCECHYWGFTASGFYSVPSGGCPTQCKTYAETMEAQWKTEGIFPLPCADAEDRSTFFPQGPPEEMLPLLAVLDLDGNGNLTYNELRVAWHQNIADTWVLDLDFNNDGTVDPQEMAPGNPMQVMLFDTDYDGVVGEAELEMVLAYGHMSQDEVEGMDLDGNGTISRDEAEQVAQSMGYGRRLRPLRVNASSRSIAGLEPRRRLSRAGRVLDFQGPTYIGSDDMAWKYVFGLFEYLWNRPNFLMALQNTVADNWEIMGIPDGKQQAVADYFAEAIIGDISEGRWMFAPDLPHPRNLTWCKYLTSWEVVMLFGLNVCNSGDYATLRSFCPVSCHCRANEEDCPSICPAR